MKVIVDIDNTLWDFSGELYRRLSRINSKVPQPCDWSEYSYYEKFIDAKTCWGIIYDIQGASRFDAYPGARELMNSLWESEHEIIVATNRHPRYKMATQTLLMNNNLVYHSLHLSNDKSTLFDESIGLVIDDSPHVIDKAKSHNIPVIGLKQAYNVNSGVPLFDDLHALIKHLEERKILVA